MPTRAPEAEAAVYRGIRNLMVSAHCADKRPAHHCAGEITITRSTITFQCKRCGDSRQLIGEEAGGDHA